MTLKRPSASSFLLIRGLWYGRQSTNELENEIYHQG